MPNTDIEAHLDNVFAEGAKNIENQVKGKVYKYFIDNSFTMLDAVNLKGICKIDSVQYDKSMDCNVYTITDLTTGQKHKADQLSIDLKPYKEEV